MKKRTISYSILSIGFLMFSCQPSSAPETEESMSIEEPTIETVAYDTNDVSSMLLAVAEANGGQKQFRANKNVQYDYYYLNPDGTKDVSVERYIFENEASWAKYTTHEVNFSPELEGDIIQFYDGKEISCHVNGEKVEDPSVTGTAQFLRQANFMWFNIMFKLSDPGTIAEYQGRKEHEGSMYDMVYLSYDSASTGKAQNDSYIFYINPKSHLVDYFNFSLPAMGVNVPVLFAELEYQEIEGVQVVTNRKMYGPDPETGELGMMLEQKLENVSFNNDFTTESLSKSI